MTFIDGFVIAVPTGNREQFIAHARHFDRMLIEEGALRVVEGWGEDVPRGEHTDFQGAVKATDDETICFSWVEWPDRATRDACHARMDERMKNGEFAAFEAEAGAMPFDGKRMIYGGFAAVVDMGKD